MSNNIVLIRYELVDEASKPARKAEKNVKGSARNLVASLGTLKAGFAAVVPSAAIAGFTAFVKQTTAATDRLGKLSIRLGENQDFLAQMGFAAERSGITVQGMNTAIQRAQRRLAEFATTGKGEAAPAIKALGLEVRNADGSIKTFQEILPDLAREFSKSGSESAKLTRAFKLFDTEGVGLLQFLKDGPEGVRALTRDFQTFGGTITRDMTGRAAELQDRFTDFDAAMAALARTISDVAAPAMTKFLEQTNKLLVVAREQSFLENVKLFGKGIVAALGQGQAGAAAAANFFAETEEAFAEAQKSAIEKAGKTAEEEEKRRLDARAAEVAAFWSESLSRRFQATSQQTNQAAQNAFAESNLRLIGDTAALDTERTRIHQELSEHAVRTSESLLSQNQATDEQVRKAEQVRKTLFDQLDARNQMNALERELAGAIGSELNAGVNNFLNTLIESNNLLGSIAKKVAEIAIIFGLKSLLNSFAPGLGGAFFGARGGVVSSFGPQNRPIPGYASGGLIRGGVPFRQGRDNVLIAGQTGEGILTREAVARLGGRRGVEALNAGGGMGGVTININAAAPEVTRNFIEQHAMPAIIRALNSPHNRTSPGRGGLSSGRAA